MQNGYKEMNNNSLFNLEEKLANMLKPVTPDPAFLNTLKTKLSHTPTILLETSKKNVGLLVLGVGLFAGALTLWVLNRMKKLKD